ncbi:SRPBCC family protein [Phenylobacterium sp.]|uniref:SRPBCC family protein n=1 Tax=Phenylobacterium sp. TaxID=1871053 RepID=UPI0012293ACE|nr:SRPBCC family protein [Phenylobacterium sp.]THD66188.1 MAG: SRPBCC family protein [Phenylobacterium sp.]
MSTAPNLMPKPLLSDAPLGEVTRQGDALQLIFRRRYDKPIEKVWAALTTPERLADWFATAEVDLRVGGIIRLGWNGVHKTDVTITVCEPPRALAWRWTIGERDTLVRFDLAPEGDGCALTLTHSGLSPDGARDGGVRAGWHAHLEALPDAMEGRATSWDTKTAREEALAAAYPKPPA